MTNFQSCLSVILQHEGYYSKDPVDKGGETFMGISRVFHKNWEGWEFIDASNRSGQVPDKVLLLPMVSSFYKTNYWDRFMGDKLPQDLAVEMLDIAVNIGLFKAVSLLQEACNLLNDNGSRWDDMKVDGVFGDETLIVVKTACDKGLRYLVNTLNVMQGAYYLDVVRRNPKQEKFLRGWCERITVVRA